MEPSVETRLSLIVRLKNRADQAAWQEFVEIYRPVIVRLAVRRKMQHADAEDLAQQVLISVSKAIGRWEIATHRARFRTWLQRVAENAILNALSRGAPDRAFGEAGHAVLVEQQAAGNGPDSDLLRLEYRREVFRWAARRFVPSFSRRRGRRSGSRPSRIAPQTTSPGCSTRRRGPCMRLAAASCGVCRRRSRKWRPRRSHEPGDSQSGKELP